MPIPYTFAAQVGPIPLSELDANFAYLLNPPQATAGSLVVSNSGGSAIIEAVSTDVGGVTAFMQANSSADVRFGNINNAPLALVTNSVPKLWITADGRVYGTALHNNAGALAGAVNQYIASGNLFTPALTNQLNVASSSVPEPAMWSRTGNVVTVSGVVIITPTAVNTPTILYMTVPINSTLPTTFAASGTCNSADGGGTTPGTIRVHAANTVRIDFITGPSIGGLTFTYTYQYVVT